MATTSIWRVKGWLENVILYTENPDKTTNPNFYKNESLSRDELQGLSDVIDYAMSDRKTLNTEKDKPVRSFVTGVNCSKDTARDEMLAVKQRYDKTGGTVAYHGYQSFAPGEGTPELAHEIGVKLAQRLWGDRYQVLVTTHLDKENHLHNHFVVNTVSFVDGMKYYRSNKDYYEMQKQSDALCREYGLSVVDQSKSAKGKNYGEWNAEKKGKPTWRSILKAEIDEAISQSMTESQFAENLKRRGYKVKFRGKDISVLPPGKQDVVQNYFRLGRNFGAAYYREGIYQQMQGRRPTFPNPPPKKRYVPKKYKSTFKQTKKLKGFRALYYHYLFLLGKLPKKRQTPSRKPRRACREDLIHINKISDEVQLLYRNRIDTAQQLAAFKEDTQKQIDTLTAERAELRRSLRRLENQPEVENFKAEIAFLSAALKVKRKELVLCDDIAARSTHIKEKVEQNKQEQKMQGSTLARKGEKYL